MIVGLIFVAAYLVALGLVLGRLAARRTCRTGFVGEDVESRGWAHLTGRVVEGDRIDDHVAGRE